MAKYIKSIVSRALAFATAFLIANSIAAADSGAPPERFWERPATDVAELRVLSWNVWLSSIFPGGLRHESFTRILKATQPDLICLQEINPSQASALPSLLSEILPPESGATWHLHFVDNGDNVILSRFPLRDMAHEAVTPRPGTFRHPNFFMGHLVALVELPGTFPLRQIYLVAAHLKSRSDEASIRARQMHADTIIRLLRRARAGEGQPALPPGTPILILGDLNVYESAPGEIVNHLNTLLTGNIADEVTFGPDLSPDWDGSHLLEVKPRHNGRGKDWYTWRSDSDQFPAGALDRILYSDSVAEIRRSFVLNTTAMTAVELEQSGLMAEDVLKAGKAGEFDHLPLVADFSFRGSLSAK